MIKNFKKLFAIVLTSMLFLCMALPVNAASATHKITIKNAGSGHTYEVYEVFKGKVSTTGHIGDADWGSGVKSKELLQALKDSAKFNELFDDCETASDVIDIISKELNDSENLKELAQIIGKNLADKKADMTESSDKYEATLEPGYYFIKDKDGSNLAQTRYILALTEDQEIIVKGETPTIAVGNKSTSSSVGYMDDFQVGDEVELQMVGSLPSYNSYNDYKTYKYAFHVTVPAGLTVEGTPVVELYKGTEKIEIDLSNFKYTPVEGGFDIACDNLKSISGLASKLQETTGAVYSPSTTLQIKVTYTVTANENVKFTNQIKSSIEYSNNPNRDGEGSTATTPEISTTLYTYTLDINKQDKETKDTLDGVGFKLYRKSDNKFAEVNEDGVITNWVEETSATELFTNEDGKITLVGLDSSVEYYLKETTTLDGYNTMKDAKIVIDSEFGDAGLTTLQITVNEDKPTDGQTTTGVLSITVENSQGKTLPSTGGVGTIIFYCIGGLLLLLAIFLIIILCKRDKDEEEETEESKTNKTNK